jgi:hypothetical protein
MITMQNKKIFFLYSTAETKLLLSYKKQSKCNIKETDLLRNYINDSKHLKLLTYWTISCNTITGFQSYCSMKVFAIEIKQSLFSQQLCAIVFLCVKT